MRSDLLRGWRPMVGVVAVGVLAFAWNLHGEGTDTGSSSGAAPLSGEVQVSDDVPTQVEGSQGGVEDVLRPSGRSYDTTEVRPANVVLEGAPSAARGAATVGDPCACDADCTDGFDCTINECDLGSNTCLATVNRPGGEPCADDGDANACTRGSCGPDNGTCVNDGSGGSPCTDDCVDVGGEAVCGIACPTNICPDDADRCRSGVCGGDGLCDLVSDCTTDGETCQRRWCDGNTAGTMCDTDADCTSPATCDVAAAPICVADVGRCCREIDGLNFCEELTYAACIESTCGGVVGGTSCTANSPDCDGNPDGTTCLPNGTHPWTDFPTCDSGCPKYSAGFAQGGPDPRSYVTVTDRPCDTLNRVGDDYTTHNAQWLQLSGFAIRGWANGYQDLDCPGPGLTCGGIPCGVSCTIDDNCIGQPEGETSCLSVEVDTPGSIVVQFWDASVTPPVIAAGFGGNVAQQVCEGTDERCANDDECGVGVDCVIDPTPVPQRVVWDLTGGDPFLVPGIGFVTVRPGIGSGETFNWELAGDVTTGVVSVGDNNGNLMWINAGPAAGTVIGTNLDVLSFELIGAKLADPPLGACCNATDGSCTDVIEAICTQTYCDGTTDVCGGLFDPPCAVGVACLQIASWQEGAVCLGGAPDGACANGACCNAGVCTTTSAGGCGGNFLGFGTDCRPNCCTQSVDQTGEICSEAPVIPINVLVTAGGDPLRTCGGAIGGTECFSDAQCTGHADGDLCELAITEITISGDNTGTVNGFCEDTGTCAGNPAIPCAVDDGIATDQDCLGQGPCENATVCSTQTDGTDCGFTCGGVVGGTLCTADAPDCVGNTDGTECLGITCVFDVVDCQNYPGDPVQWVAFHTDRTSNLEIDFCCTEGATQGGAKGLMYIALRKLCDLSGDVNDCGDTEFYDFADQPSCDDDGNRTFLWPGLEAGTYWYPISGDTWCEGQATQPTDGCERDSDCDPGFFCVEDQGPYQFHIRAQALRREVCCLQSFRCGGDVAGAVCDIDADCVGDPAGTICGGLCQTLTAPDCEALGGFSVTDAPVCQGGPTGSCMKGSCCTPGVPGQDPCDDNGGVQLTKNDCTDGNFIGGATCDLNPCPVCTLDSVTHCNDWEEPPGSNWMIPIDRSNVDADGNWSRIADDFIPATSGQITSVCWVPGYVRGGGDECSDPIDQPTNQQWRVDFYYGNGGIPGALLMSVDIPDEIIVRQGLPDPFRGWNYSAEIAGPTLTAGEIYWISFSAMGEGTQDESCNIFWYQSVAANGWAMRADSDEAWQDGQISRVLDPGGANEGIHDQSFCISLGIDHSLAEYSGTCCECDGSTCHPTKLHTECNDVIQGNWFSHSFFCGGVEYGTPCRPGEGDCVGNPDGVDCLMDAHRCPGANSTLECPGQPANDECPGADTIAHGGNTCGGALGGSSCASDGDCVGNPDGLLCGPEDISVFYDNRCATTSVPNYSFEHCEFDACDPWGPEPMTGSIGGTARDQWYSYVAPCNGVIDVDNCLEIAVSDPIIAIYNLDVTTCGGVTGGAVCSRDNDCWRCGGVLNGTPCGGDLDCTGNPDGTTCSPAATCDEIAVDEDCPVPLAAESVICSDERCNLTTCNGDGGLVSLAVQAGERYMIRNANFDDESRGSGLINLHITCAPPTNPDPPLGADEMSVPGAATWPLTSRAVTCTADIDCANEAVCLPDAAGGFPGTCYVPKNRYLAVGPNPDVTSPTARRVSVELTQRLCDGTGPACVSNDDCGGTCDDLAIPCASNAECNALSGGATCASTGTCVQVLGFVTAPFGKGYASIEATVDPYSENWNDGQYPIDCGTNNLCPANAYCHTGLGGSVTCKWSADDTEVMWSYVFIGDCRIGPMIRDVVTVAQGGLGENKAPRYYLIESILATADITDESAYSAALILPTVKVWGDSMGASSGGISTPPNDLAGFTDVLHQVFRFKDTGQGHLSWSDLHPQDPNQLVGFQDMLDTVNGFKDKPYPYDDPCTCAGIATPCGSDFNDND